MRTCKYCAEPIHEEPSPSPFSPFWCHDNGSVTCEIEWAHPTLGWMDNAILHVRTASPA